MQICILQVLIFIKQQKNSTWNLRKEDNFKPDLHNSMFFKSHLQYNARKLFNKLPEALNKEQNLTIRKKNNG